MSKKFTVGATFCRIARPAPKALAPVPEPRKPSPRALSPEEKDSVLSELHSDRFIDRAPAEVVATLLDEGKRLCSERTMYRILSADGEVIERRNQSRHPKFKMPPLQATDFPGNFRSIQDARAFCGKFFD